MNCCSKDALVRKLSAVSKMKRGTSITKKDIVEGNIPVISGGQAPAYYCNKSNRTEDVITIAGSGAYAGFVQYWNKPIFVCDAFSVQGIDGVTNTKYLYYVLQGMQNKIFATKKGSGVPHVHISCIENFEIPIPPLAVQEEIVRILDKFTELEAELEKELETRKKQYEWCRDRLLDSTSNAEHVAVGSLVSSGFVEIVTPAIKIQRNMYQETGVVPIVSQEIERISGYCNIDDQRIPIANYVCFGDHSEHIKYIDFSFVQGADGLKIMKPNETKIIAKYFYYAIQGKYARRNNYERHFKYLQETKIPVPPIEEQRRIVSILDHFDALCNDTATGLPAEIAARRKQYEYYRDKLLSFEWAA